LALPKIAVSRLSITNILFIDIFMTKEELLETIQRILSTDVDLTFLLQLKRQELETLLACIRAGLGK
jgi:hypothetical protein